MKSRQSLYICTLIKFKTCSVGFGLKVVTIYLRPEDSINLKKTNMKKVTIILFSCLAVILLISACETSKRGRYGCPATEKVIH